MGSKRSRNIVVEQNSKRPKTFREAIARNVLENIASAVKSSVVEVSKISVSLSSRNRRRNEENYKRFPRYVKVRIHRQNYLPISFHFCSYLFTDSRYTDVPNRTCNYRPNTRSKIPIEFYVFKIERCYRNGQLVV